MRYILILTMAFVTACSTIANIGEYANNNPVVIDIATRQAVYRYIDAAETEQGKADRAGDVVQRLRNVDAYLQGNPTASIETLLVVLEQQIDWESLSNADQILVLDIMTLVKANLESKANEQMLDADAIVGLRSIINIAITTASML